uniref:BTB domain-containing protein n=1 Tax=Panagrolaimus sp. PS1159 TaxID=55785 RepID=A0AC35FW91_9BILA
MNLKIQSANLYDIVFTSFLNSDLSANMSNRINANWTIGYVLLRELAIFRSSVGSTVVSSNGILFHVAVAPNGFKEENLGQTCFIFRVISGTENKVQINFTVSFGSRKFTKKGSFIFTPGVFHDYPTLICSTLELFDPRKVKSNIYPPRNISDLKVWINIRGTLNIVKDAPFNLRLNPKINIGKKLWNRENDKDFTVIVGKDEIKVHKCVLGAQSPVFDRMFETKMKEGIENRVEITDFPYNIVEAGIKLCYDKTLASLTSMNDACLLLQFYDKYDIQNLKACIEASLIPKLSLPNVCELANVSIITNSSKLKEKCREFLVNCISADIRIPNFDILDDDFANDLIK